MHDCTILRPPSPSSSPHRCHCYWDETNSAQTHPRHRSRDQVQVLDQRGHLAKRQWQCQWGEWWQ